MNMPPDKRQPIKIGATYASRARELVAYASRNGWSSLGVERDDPPTMTAILEEAIDVLSQRAKKKER